MIVEFAGGITSASGTLCKNRNGSRVIVTTRRAPSSNKNKVRMYLRSADSYKRKKPLSDAEIAAHDLFTRRAKYVKELMDAGMRRDKAWKIAKQTIQ